MASNNLQAHICITLVGDAVAVYEYDNQALAWTHLTIFGEEVYDHHNDTACLAKVFADINANLNLVSKLADVEFTLIYAQPQYELLTGFMQNLADYNNQLWQVRRWESLYEKAVNTLSKTQKPNASETVQWQMDNILPLLLADNVLVKQYNLQSEQLAEKHEQKISEIKAALEEKTQEILQQGTEKEQALALANLEEKQALHIQIVQLEATTQRLQETLELNVHERQAEKASFIKQLAAKDSLLHAQEQQFKNDITAKEKELHQQLDVVQRQTMAIEEQHFSELLASPDKLLVKLLYGTPSEREKLLTKLKANSNKPIESIFGNAIFESDKRKLNGYIQDVLYATTDSRE